jgi:RimJ/RimL family protein N-acetyltransferase
LIRAERTRDYELARQIITHPQIYPAITDDSSPAREAYQPIESEALIYLALYDDAELIGMFLFVPITGVTLEVHTCILPTAWGARAGEAARVAMAWIWANTPAARIVGSVPESNRLAHRFGKRAFGMTEYGRNPAAIRKRGRLQDLILLGISKPQE